MNYYVAFTPVESSRYVWAEGVEVEASPRSILWKSVNLMMQIFTRSFSTSHLGSVQDPYNGLWFIIISICLDSNTVLIKP